MERIELTCKQIISLMIGAVCILPSPGNTQASAHQNVALRADKKSHPTDLPEFDVVSIRPSNPDSHVAMIGPAGDNEYRAIGVPLGLILERAYFPPAFWLKSRIQRAPSWVWNEQYDVIAKVSPDNLPEWRRMNEYWSPLKANTIQQSMLQNVLKDRCDLAVHMIPYEAPGLALVVGKHGLISAKVKRSEINTKLPEQIQKIALGGEMMPIVPGGQQKLVFYRTSMASLAGELSVIEGTPVRDDTGVVGEFDFSVERWRNDDGSYSFDLNALGLKIQKTKLSTSMLFVDRIKRPTSN